MKALGLFVATALLASQGILTQIMQPQPTASGSSPIPGPIQSNFTGSVSTTLPFKENITAASSNIILCGQKYGGGSGLNLTCTDSAGNTFTQIGGVSFLVDGDTAEVSCAVITTGGADTITFKSGGSTTSMAGWIEEVHGTNGCTLDGSAMSDYMVVGANNGVSGKATLLTTGGIVGNGTTATAHCGAASAANCTFPTGTLVNIAGDSQSGFNGLQTVTGQSANTFTFASAVNATGNGGTASLSITTSTANDLVVQFGSRANIDTYFAGPGWSYPVEDFDYQNGQVEMTSQALYTPGTVSATDVMGGAKENGAVLFAIKPATGAAPTTPTIDASCQSGAIVISGTQVCGPFTINASAVSLVVHTFVDSNSETITEVCEYPGANTYSTTCAAASGVVLYLAGRAPTILPGGVSALAETWTRHSPLTGSVKIHVTWSGAGDLTSFNASSILGGNSAFNFAQATGSVNGTGTTSVTIASATNHLVIDGMMINQNTTCQTQPTTTGTGQTLIGSGLCNGSGNWWYQQSYMPGASSVTIGWNVTTAASQGWAQGVLDAY
jgi:hypothetical protein